MQESEKRRPSAKLLSLRLHRIFLPFFWAQVGGDLRLEVSGSP